MIKEIVHISGQRSYTILNVTDAIANNKARFSQKVSISVKVTLFARHQPVIDERHATKHLITSDLIDVQRKLQSDICFGEVTH